MGRAHRIEVPGGIYHVGTRGNDRQPIYFGNWSGRLFVAELDRAAARYAWRVLAYCLMGNHYHVVLQIGDGGLSRGMCELNGRFAQITNCLTGRTGHLFGRRFWSGLVDTDEYLLEVCRYVLLNPVRSALIDDPRRWRWSSMRATLGPRRRSGSLDVGLVLGQLDRDPGRARAAFAAFVDAGC